MLLRSKRRHPALLLLALGGGCGGQHRADGDAPCTAPCPSELDAAPTEDASCVLDGSASACDGEAAVDGGLGEPSCRLQQEALADAFIRIPGLVANAQGFGSAWYDLDHSRFDFAAWDGSATRPGDPQRIDEGYARSLRAVWSADRYAFATARASNVLLQLIPSRADGRLELDAPLLTRELARDIRPQAVELVRTAEGYAVVWEDERGQDHSALTLARTNAEGDVVSTTEFSEPDTRSHSPRLIAEGDGAALVWSEQRGQLARILFARVDGQGALRAPARELTTLASAWAYPLVTRVPRGLAIAVVQRSVPEPKTLLLHVASSGEPLGPPASFGGMSAGVHASGSATELLLYTSQGHRDLLEVDNSLGSIATSAQLRVVRVEQDGTARERAIVDKLEVREFGRPTFATGDATTFVWADSTRLWLGRVSCL